MDTIDASSNDAELWRAEEADAKRFPPNAEFEVWCWLSAWKLEEATALSLGIDPNIISREIIKHYGLTPHPHFVKTDQDLLRLSRRAAIYEERLRHLERACSTGEFENAMRVGDTWEVRPLDFLDWFERQAERHGARYPWNGLSPLFVKQVRKGHIGTQNAKRKEAAVSKAGKSSFGVKAGKGPDACRGYLRSEMCKLLEDASYSNRDGYAPYCTKRFDISERAFFKIWTEIATETDCPWAKPGRRRNAA